MSDADPRPGDPKDPLSAIAERALDLLVFAPAGAVLSALEDVPGMAARGRAVIEQEVRNAHLVGQFAVGAGQRRLQRSLGRLTGSGTEHGEGTEDEAEPAGAGTATGHQATIEADEEPPPFEPRTPSPATTEEPPPAPVVAGSAAAPTEREAAEAATAADHAIPGYDTLSASQVVRRLDGLGPEELAAVFRHESATRGRRTILHRAQQLLGSAPPPEA